MDDGLLPNLQTRMEICFPLHVLAGNGMDPIVSDQEKIRGFGDVLQSGRSAHIIRALAMIA